MVLNKNNELLRKGSCATFSKVQQYKQANKLTKPQTQI